MQPKVSVVMTCYNSEKFLKEAIDSILSQTFTNFEFIIWNDGSTDKTEEIINSYKDSRIRYFYHENTGFGEASYLACKEVKGEYIARMDADDISLPTRFEKEVEYLDNHPNVVLVSTAVHYIDDGGNYLGDSFPFTSAKAIQKCFKHGSCIIHPATMMRKSVYEKTGGYLKLKRGTDHVIFSKMLQYGAFYNFAEPLFCYRISESSISTAASNNPYSDIISLMRRKMIYDKVVSNEYINIYNKLVDLAKEFCKNNTETFNNARKGQLVSVKEQNLFSILKPIIGEKNARSSICSIKNLYASILL